MNTSNLENKAYKKSTNFNAQNCSTKKNTSYKMYFR